MLPLSTPDNAYGFAHSTQADRAVQGAGCWGKAGGAGRRDGGRACPGGHAGCCAGGNARRWRRAAAAGVAGDARAGQRADVLQHGQTRRPGSGEADRLRLETPSRSRTTALLALGQSCGRLGLRSAAVQPHRGATQSTVFRCGWSYRYYVHAANGLTAWERPKRLQPGWEQSADESGARHPCRTCIPVHPLAPPLAPLLLYPRAPP